MISRRRFLAISAAALASPAAASQPVRWQGRAMGADVSLTIDAPERQALPALADMRRVLGVLDEEGAVVETFPAKKKRIFDERVCRRDMAVILADVVANTLPAGQYDAEAEAVAASAAELAEELEHQRGLLEGHVEMMALLGRPGTMQLLYDGSRGGDLEGAVSTVAVLTAGQLRLVEEYQDLHHERNARLAELSRILSLARDEAEELAGRRADLERVRQRVDSEIKRLTRSQRSAESELEELRPQLARLGDGL